MKIEAMPKSLIADEEYCDEIRDETGNLTITVYGQREDPRTREIRDEIINRWNAYEILRDALMSVQKLLGHD